VLYRRYTLKSSLRWI